MFNYEVFQHDFPYEEKQKRLLIKVPERWEHWDPVLDKTLVSLFLLKKFNYITTVFNFKHIFKNLKNTKYLLIGDAPLRDMFQRNKLYRLIYYIKLVLLYKICNIFQLKIIWIFREKSIESWPYKKRILRYLLNHSHLIISNLTNVETTKLLQQLNIKMEKIKDKIICSDSENKSINRCIKMY